MKFRASLQILVRSLPRAPLRAKAKRQGDSDRAAVPFFADVFCASVFLADESNLLRLVGFRFFHPSIGILGWAGRFFDRRRHRLGGRAHAVLRGQRGFDSHHDLHANLMPKSFEWKPAARAGTSSNVGGKDLQVQVELECQIVVVQIGPPSFGPSRTDYRRRTVSENRRGYAAGKFRFLLFL